MLFLRLVSYNHIRQLVQEYRDNRLNLSLAAANQADTRHQLELKDCEIHEGQHKGNYITRHNINTNVLPLT